MKANKALFRILDANFNRAKEALRVAEDLTRFVLDDKKLTAEAKSCRHNLTRILLNFSAAGYEKLLAARDSGKDVGRSSALKDRPGSLKCKDLMAANMKRAQEASRVLEEISKVLAPREAASLQRLRFRLYELEKRSIQKF